jgi:excisionase family DNA binding protein
LCDKVCLQEIFMNAAPPRPRIPSPQDIKVAQSVLAQLQTLRSKDPELQLSLGKKPVVLPAHLARLVEEMLAQTANGQAVSLQTLKGELSSQEAADYLGVSRQFLVDEADAGKLPYRKIGSHRRFQLQDVLAYEQKLEAESLEARQALADEAQRLGLDD